MYKYLLGAIRQHCVNRHIGCLGAIAFRNIPNYLRMKCQSLWSVEENWSCKGCACKKWSCEHEDNVLIILYRQRQWLEAFLLYPNTPHPLTYTTTPSPSPSRLSPTYQWRIPRLPLLTWEAKTFTPYLLPTTKSTHPQPTKKSTKNTVSSAASAFSSNMWLLLFWNLISLRLTLTNEEKVMLKIQKCTFDETLINALATTKMTGYGLIYILNVRWRKNKERIFY